MQLVQLCGSRRGGRCDPTAACIPFEVSAGVRLHQCSPRTGPSKDWGCSARPVLRRGGPAPTMPHQVLQRRAAHGAAHPHVLLIKVRCVEGALLPRAQRCERWRLCGEMEHAIQRGWSFAARAMQALELLWNGIGARVGARRLRDCSGAAAQNISGQKVTTVALNQRMRWPPLRPAKKLRPPPPPPSQARS